MRKRIKEIQNEPFKERTLGQGIMVEVRNNDVNKALLTTFIPSGFLLFDLALSIIPIIVPTIKAKYKNNINIGTYL